MISENTIRRITKDLNLCLNVEEFDETRISIILNNYFKEEIMMTSEENARLTEEIKKDREFELWIDAQMSEIDEIGVDLE